MARKMVVYFAIVVFKDKSRQIVLSSDIKDFKPKHCDDFDSDVYHQVAWQDAESESFDGCYEGKVLVLAASLSELVTKAKALKVRVPGNFDNMKKLHGNGALGAKQTHSKKKKSKTSEMIVNQKKSTRKASEINTEVTRGRTRRVENTIAAVKRNLPVTASRPDSPLPKVHHENVAKTEEINDSDGETLLEGERDSLLVDVKKVIEVKKRTRDSDECESTASNSSSDASVGVILEENKELKRQVARIDTLKDSLKEIKEKNIVVEGTNSFLNKLYNKVKEENASLKIVNAKQKSKIEFLESILKISSGGEKQDLDATLPVTPNSPDDVQLSFITSRDKGNVECASRQLFSSRDTHTLMKKNSDHGECLSTNNLSSPSNKRKHKPTSTKIFHSSPVPKGSHLSGGGSFSEICHMNDPWKSLSPSPSKRQRSAPSPIEGNADGDSSFKLRLSSLCSKSQGSNSLEQDGVTSPLKTKKTLSNSNDDLSSVNKKKLRTSLEPEAPQEEMEGEDSISDDKSHEIKLQVTPWMRDICDRVKKDMTGEKKLPLDEKKRVIISDSVRVNEKKWSLTIKAQKKNSLFVKKLAHAVYGPDKLKVRTLALPGKKYKDKVIATPKKVDSITACYLARLEVNNPSGSHEDKAVEEARHFLSEKMQDDARKKK